MVIKYRLIVLLFTLCLSAFCKSYSLELFISKSYGDIFWKGEVGEKKINIKYNSNIFSIKDDKSFKTYSTKLKNKKILLRLERLYERIEKLQSTLLVSGSSLEKLYPRKRDEGIIRFEKFTVTRSSPFYLKLKKTMKEISNIKPQDISLSVQMKEDIIFLNSKGKEQKIRVNRDEICSGLMSSKTCKIKDLGFISL